MNYLPKSQVVTNQYSSGNEFTLNGSDYVGPYYKTSTGEVYTGKTPSDPNSTKLEQYQPGVTDTEANTPNSVPLSGSQEIYPTSYNEYYYQYQNALKQPFRYKASLPPIPSVTFPTEKQYEVGEFQRFFLKKNNESKYIEVSKDTFNLFTEQDSSVQWELYSPIRINWELTGAFVDVFKVNRNTVRLIEQEYNLYGFYASFREKFAKYYNFNEGEGLFTDGSEFVNRRTRKPYRGFYHVHPSKGPMIGKNHIDSPHDYLDLLEDEDVGSSIRANIPSRRSGGY